MNSALPAILAALLGCSLGPPASNPRGPSVTLLAVGDVMLDRAIGRAVAAHGPAYPFAPTLKLIRRADVAVFNLECVLSTRGEPQHELYVFRADPSMALELATAGFKVAVLANNHTLDFGREALMDTIHAAEVAGMVAVGAGEDRAHAEALKVVTARGLRVGFLAFTDVPDAGVERRDNAPTVAFVGDRTLASEVAAARKKCDSLIVFFHWGVEYMKRPTERQQALARKCVDAGADLVLGCHPHVLQTVETYKGKPIVYSLGGFVFDSKRFGSDKSAMFFFELRRHAARLVRTVPIVMKGGRTLVGR